MKSVIGKAMTILIVASLLSGCFLGARLLVMRPVAAGARVPVAGAAQGALPARMAMRVAATRSSVLMTSANPRIATVIGNGRSLNISHGGRSYTVERTGKDLVRISASTGEVSQFRVLRRPKWISIQSEGKAIGRAYSYDNGRVTRNYIKSTKGNYIYTGYDVVGKNRVTHFDPMGRQTGQTTLKDVKADNRGVVRLGFQAAKQAKSGSGDVVNLRPDATLGSSPKFYDMRFCTGSDFDRAREWCRKDQRSFPRGTTKVFYSWKHANAYEGMETKFETFMQTDIRVKDRVWGFADGFDSKNPTEYTWLANNRGHDSGTYIVKAYINTNLQFSESFTVQ